MTYLLEIKFIIENNYNPTHLEEIVQLHRTIRKSSTAASHEPEIKKDIVQICFNNNLCVLMCIISTQFLICDFKHR